MSHQTIRIILSLPLSAVLVAISGLHFYWAMGGFWPGKDGPSLTKMVVGGGSSPGPGATYVVAFGLLGAAAAVLMSGGVVVIPSLAHVTRIATFALAGCFLLRGIGGFFEKSVRPSIVGTPYQSLSLRIYSPLCVVLGVGIAALLV